MLTEEEIRRIARKKGMSVGLVEKDYVIEWLLKGIYESKLKEDLTFKGGTAIKKAYFQKFWRYSHDLDFTSFSDPKALRERLEKVFRKIKEMAMIELEFKSFHVTEGSVIASVQFLGPLRFKNRIRIDITSDEVILTKPLLKTLKSDYPDVESYEVKVYSLEEILAEKIRSILQRGKSRDYYDVWMLLKVGKFDFCKVRELVAKKCRFKGIRFGIELVFEEKKLEEAKRYGEIGLKDLVKNLPDFNSVIKELREMLKPLA